MTPHARHLREMRADRPVKPAPGLPLALASLSMLAAPIDEAAIARAREHVRDLHLRRDIADPTRRHLEEMRDSVMAARRG